MMLIINNKISWSFFYTCAMFWYLKPALLYNKLKAFVVFMSECKPWSLFCKGRTAITY